ncbi:hypothetical protein GCM10010431_56270 [Streptomyces kunmingensis]
MVEDPVEVGRPGQLHLGARLELGEIRCRQRREASDPGAVDDAPDGRALRLHLRDEPGQCLVVRHVAGRDGHLDTRRTQVLGQFSRARRVRAPARRQDQPLRARLHQPTRRLRTQPARAARHQRRTTRPPRHLAPGGGQRFTLQPAQQHRAVPDRQLVLRTLRREDPGQALRVARRQHLRQIDQATPPLRVLQADHQAKTPAAALHRMSDTVPVDRRHRSLRAQPHRHSLVPVGQRLREQHVQRQTRTQRRMLGVRTLVESQ